MTCIVGLVDRDHVWIGGDSLGTNGTTAISRKDAKVFRNGDYLIGFTSSFRMGQLLMHGWDVPVPPKQSNRLFPFMVTEFVDTIRQRFKDGGYGKVQDGMETGGNFLVATGNRLFEIDSDYQVGETIYGYAAIGCGWEAAMGSLFSTHHYTSPRHRVTTSLKAASEFSTSVRGPFKVLHT